MPVGAWIGLAVLLGIGPLLTAPVRLSIVATRQPGQWGDTETTVSWLGVVLRRDHWRHAAWWTDTGQAALRRLLQPRPASTREAAGKSSMPAYLVTRLRVRRWRLVLGTGTGDAAMTAWLSGCLQAAAGIGSAWLSRLPPFAGVRPHVLVVPNFQQSGVHVYLQCIVTVAPAHIIAAGAIHLCERAGHWRERRKRQRQEGRRLWPIIRFRA